MKPTRWSRLARERRLLDALLRHEGVPRRARRCYAWFLCWERQKPVRFGHLDLVE